MKEFVSEMMIKEGYYCYATSETAYFGKMFHGFKLLLHKDENTDQMLDHAEGLANDYVPWNDDKLQLAEVYCYQWWLFYRFQGRKRYHIDYFNCHATTNTL